MMSDLPDNPTSIELDHIYQLCGNKWWRMNHLYKIEDENGKLVTFKMRPAQVLLFRLMHQKNILVKARQLGFSTAIDLYLLDEALWNKNLKCGIIAQDQSAAGEIFRTKIEIPYDNLLSYIKSQTTVVSRNSGKTGGYILFGNNSSIQCATSFRSGTVQRLHISEMGKVCAKYPQKAQEIKTGTLNAVHQDSICFIESTAEGVGGDFHSMSMKALDLKNAGVPLSKMDWKFHFFAWYQDPKYCAAVPSAGLFVSKAMKSYFLAVERAQKIKLTPEQKQWYLNKQDEQGEDLMKQEFPSTPTEAFLVSGRRVFNAIHVMQVGEGVSQPLIVYDMSAVTGKKEKVEKPKRLIDKEAQKKVMNLLLVWELPDQDVDYAIGVDIAEGLEHGDRSSLDVVRQDTGEQVAHWFGHLDAEFFAMLSAHIGKMYNTAYIGPERNNHGHAYIQKLKDIYPISRIYAEQYIDRADEDETVKLGWLTTRSSKPILMESMKTLLKARNTGIKWAGTVGELDTYVYDAKGSMNAQDSCYDDQVMSYAIAQEMRIRMPIRQKIDTTSRPVLPFGQQ